jgi:hypothetical protein
VAPRRPQSIELVVRDRRFVEVSALSFAVEPIAAAVHDDAE